MFSIANNAPITLQCGPQIFVKEISNLKRGGKII